MRARSVRSKNAAPRGSAVAAAAPDVERTIADAVGPSQRAACAAIARTTACGMAISRAIAGCSRVVATHDTSGAGTPGWLAPQAKSSST